MCDRRIVPDPSSNGKWKSTEPTASPAASAPFNPYCLYAYRIPWTVLRNPNLSWGAKALYGVLALHLGKPRPEGNRCTISVEKLTQEMRATTDTIKRWRTELVDGGWGTVVRRGRTAAEWVFNPPLDIEVAKMPLRESHENTNNPPQTSSNGAEMPLPSGISARSEVAILPAAYKEENVSENSSVHRGAASPTHPSPTRPTMTTEKSPRKPELDSTNGMRGEFTAIELEVACHLLKAASEQSHAPAAAETLVFLREARTFERFRAWLDALCESGRNRLIRSYNGFLTDLKRWAPQNPQLRSRPIDRVWESPKFECGQCFDDPDGIRERGGVLEWCTCDRARQTKAVTPGLLVERQQEHDSLEAALTSLMSKTATTSGREVVVASDTQVQSRADRHEVVEAIECSKCGGSNTRYIDRVENCDCPSQPQLTGADVLRIPPLSDQELPEKFNSGAKCRPAGRGQHE